MCVCVCVLCWLDLINWYCASCDVFCACVYIYILVRVYIYIHTHTYTCTLYLILDAALKGFNRDGQEKILGGIVWGRGDI